MFFLVEYGDGAAWLFYGERGPHQVCRDFLGGSGYIWSSTMGAEYAFIPVNLLLAGGISVLNKLD